MRKQLTDISGIMKTKSRNQQQTEWILSIASVKRQDTCKLLKEMWVAIVEMADKTEQILKSRFHQKKIRDIQHWKTLWVSMEFMIHKQGNIFHMININICSKGNHPTLLKEASSLISYTVANNQHKYRVMRAISKSILPMRWKSIYSNQKSCPAKSD